MELILHQRFHSSQKKWCGQCGYLFTSLYSCQQHLDMHRKQLFICPICNRSYSDKHSILKHVNQHFETVLHMCKFCGKVYNAKNRLMEHIKTHSETKVHSCNYCDKSFTKLSHLQQHLNTHTGAKPYKCPICPKTFTAYANWNKHLHRMHNVDEEKYRKEINKYEDTKGIMLKNDSNDTKEIIHNSKQIVNEKDPTIENSEMDICNNIPEPKERNEISKLDTYVFYEQDDSTIESDIIDHIIIENELQLFENNINRENNVIQTVDVTSATEPIHGLITDIPQYPQTINYPPEYGPEFVSTGLETGCSSGFINLDDHNLPHIDPLLTIKIEEHDRLYVNTPHYQGNFTPNIEYSDYIDTPKWEPPILTKVQQDLYDMTDANKLMLLNSDNFEVFT